MKNNFLFFILILLFGCKPDKAKPNHSTEEQINQPKQEVKQEQSVQPECDNGTVALDFINGYLNSEGFAWLEKENITQAFKDKYDSYLQGYLDVDFDPIITSEDYPQTFKVLEVAKEYVIIGGEEEHWRDFNITLRVVNCKVDGCGLINIGEPDTSSQAKKSNLLQYVGKYVHSKKPTIVFEFYESDNKLQIRRCIDGECQEYGTAGNEQEMNELHVFGLEGFAGASSPKFTFAEGELHIYDYDAVNDTWSEDYYERLK